MSNYKDVKNLIHNDLEIDVQQIIENEVERQITRLLNNKSYLYSLIEKLIMREMKHGMIERICRLAANRVTLSIEKPVEDEN